MAKFTTTEITESEASQIFATEASREEARPKSPEDRVELDEAFTLKTSQARRRGRPAAPKAKPVIQGVAEAPANYRLWSQLLIGSTNTVVVTWLGQECAMERREAEMLEPPIARILERLPTSQAQKMATFIDPMVILIALGTWGNRIVRIQRAKKPGLVTQEELARASGITVPPPANQEYSQPSVVADDLPPQKIEVNPNGIPVAITEQMGDF